MTSKKTNTKTSKRRVTRTMRKMCGLVGVDIVMWRAQRWKRWEKGKERGAHTIIYKYVLMKLYE